MKLINFGIETIAMLDLISDVIITGMLISSPNTGWAVVTVSAMLGPQLISNILLTQHLLDKFQARDRNQANCMLVFMACLSLTPAFVGFQMLMDVSYIFSSVILEPIA